MLRPFDAWQRENRLVSPQPKLAAMKLCLNNVGQALQPRDCTQLIACQLHLEMLINLQMEEAFKKPTFAELFPSRLSAFHCASATAKAASVHEHCTTTPKSHWRFQIVRAEFSQIVEANALDVDMNYHLYYHLVRE